MPIGKWWNRGQEVPGAPRVRGLAVTADEWKNAARDAAAGGGRLLSLWVSQDVRSAATFWVFAAYWIDPGILLAELLVRPDGDAPAYPGLEETFPAASRMQRAAFSGPERAG